MFQERKALKHVNHSRKIFELYATKTQWFQTAILASDLARLYNSGYGIISTDMQGAFAERWHKETSSFHFPVGELTITLDDISL